MCVRALCYSTCWGGPGSKPRSPALGSWGVAVFIHPAGSPAPSCSHIPGFSHQGQSLCPSVVLLSFCETGFYQCWRSLSRLCSHHPCQPCLQLHSPFPSLAFQVLQTQQTQFRSGRTRTQRTFTHDNRNLCLLSRNWQGWKTVITTEGKGNWALLKDAYLLCRWKAEKGKKKRSKGNRREGRGAGVMPRLTAHCNPPSRRKLTGARPTEKLTLDTIALASSTVFFKTCFIFSFGAIKMKKDSSQPHSFFRGIGMSSSWPAWAGELDMWVFQFGFDTGT